MKTLFKISLFCCLISFNYKAANIHLKNNLKKPVKIAITIYSSSDKFKGFITLGWWLVEPGENIDTKIEVLDGSNIWFYGYTEADKNGQYQNWTSNKYFFLVSPFQSKFYIKNSNMKYVKENNPLYVLNGFMIHKINFEGESFLPSYILSFG